MYPKNFLDYKLYLRRLELPKFITEWFGNKNICLNKISREALRYNLDINELLINTAFQILLMLNCNPEESNQMIGDLISRMLDKQQSFESFKYYKYGLEDYNKRKDRLENKYQELLAVYHNEMNKIAQEREEHIQQKDLCNKISLENQNLKDKVTQLEKEVKNIHDAAQKENLLSNDRIQYLEEENHKLSQSLTKLSEEKEKVQLVYIESKESNEKSISELVNRFEVDFNKLVQQKVSLQEENTSLINEIQILYDKQQSKSNNNDGQSKQYDYYENYDNLQVTKSILSFALEEIKRISRDGQLTNQLKSHIKREKYCIEYFMLNSHLSKEQKKQVQEMQRKEKEEYDQERNSFIPSSSTGQSKRKQKPVNDFKEWNRLNANRR